MTIPRIVIAGTHSGCGKTTVATGLMGALVKMGYVVQPFKVGPDFIDPTHHTAICGRPSRNLDPFMMGEDGVLKTFQAASAGADIAVIEGVMGMYDGLEGTDNCSTAHISKILSAPLALVVDAGSMSRSANALVKGFAEFDPSIRLAGVIFNHVGSHGHRQMIEDSLSVRAFGWIPKRSELEVQSRHLGLKMADEVGPGKAADIIGEFVDVGAILDVARAAGPLPGYPVSAVDGDGKHDVKIGVARDAAFCFYYQDSLDLLSSYADVVYFSPMQDSLPDVDALYFGGGYPELYAKELESSPCRVHVLKAIDDGMPVYAECGGLMYLCEELSHDGTYRMVGALPARAEMTRKIQALGYVKGESITGGIFGSGTVVSGHEFHFSSVDCDSDARFTFKLSRGKGIRDGLDGISEHNVVAGYTHSYFSPEFAGSIVKAAEVYRRK